MCGMNLCLERKATCWLCVCFDWHESKKSG